MPSIIHYRHYNSRAKEDSKHRARMNGIHETKYWHQIEDGRVQCDLCPRYCRLKEGQQGLCFVRQNQNQKIVLTSYGRSSGFCIDPIEKKPLNHFLPGTPVLSFGTAGCNLACKFCQNWDISKSQEMETLADSASPEKLVQLALSTKCRSIAFTYNDPVIFHEYAIDVAIAAREQGVNTVAVTAGYVCEEPRKEFFSHMSAANIDLKAFSDGFYRSICGGKLSVILDTLLYLHNETDTWFELTTLLIPGENDSEQEIEKMARWIVDNLGFDIPLHFTAFHPDFKMRGHSPTPPSTLTRSRQIAIDTGMNYVYTGNVHDASGGSTYCSKCSAQLIERDWYELGAWNLDEQACCHQCRVVLPGVFEARPGTWGSKRQVLDLSEH
ncbi:MAG: AmmeMemoRadiSam system radical SAM enzyme [Pseudomonadales bacterium]|nr:AmmeMemoRadiSam system radical SAM enzyme [Pseudomonadales bacterium]